MEKLRVSYYCIGALLGFLLGICIGHILFVDASTKTKERKTIKIIRDTIPSRDPIAKDSSIVSYIKVPVPYKVIKTIRDVQNNTISAPKDTALATIPRTQKRYEDSTYTAWVSGYQPSLDSINVYRKTIYITETKTVTKRNAFGLGIIGGTGYGIFSRKPDVFVGIGGYIRLW